VNLVGHVAVAVAPTRETTPSAAFLVGCMLPDLAAIARVRLIGIPRDTDEDLGRGIVFHHACDAVFHESDWFRDRQRVLRDALVDAGVDRGAARACSHAGVEMLLDGGLVVHPHIEGSAQRTLDAIDATAEDLGHLVHADARAGWVARLHRIGRALEPRRYAEPRFVAERLHGMTAGRRRIELATEDVPQVTRALERQQLGIAADAPRVVAFVAARAPSA
jgi:hypothetical protein